jgi:hypothetical protein
MVKNSLNRIRMVEVQQYLPTYKSPAPDQQVKIYIPIPFSGYRPRWQTAFTSPDPRLTAYIAGQIDIL